MSKKFVKVSSEDLRDLGPVVASEEQDSFFQPDFKRWKKEGKQCCSTSFAQRGNSLFTMSVPETRSDKYDIYIYIYVYIYIYIEVKFSSMNMIQNKTSS